MTHPSTPEAHVKAVRRWQDEKIAAGLCGRCGAEPIAKGSKRACAGCLAVDRRRSGCRPWREGGPGRPPL